MIKSSLMWLGTLVTGALLGSVLGKVIAMIFPYGRIHNLFATETVAGLHPAHLDLRIIDVTFGCLLHFNFASVLGIVAAAVLFKSILS